MKQTGRFGLPLEVKFCTRCVESNQRMMGSVQHKDKPDSKRITTEIDDQGVCAACRLYEESKSIDWAEREREFKDILDRHRRNDGQYDVLFPGSGGKDSCYTTHLLKNKYGMNPLTITWAPHIYTDIGWKNFQAWIHSGFDNILYTPNGRIHRTLARLAFKNLLHPFQPFVLGQNYLALKIAIERNIKLVIYGDSHAVRGGSKLMKYDGREANLQLLTKEDNDSIYLGGVSIPELSRYGIKERDLNMYLPACRSDIEEAGIETYRLPYFITYDSQRAFYSAVEHSGFEPNPDGRSEGTYTKYSSLDDKLDGFHYFTWYTKTGRGRATEDAALDVRNGHISREEGVALVKRFDGEFPKKYFKEFLWYIEMSEEEFWETIDSFRSEHIWKKVGESWELRQQVT